MPSAIPDANKKLSYDCLKCVIQKFEVNFRFRLSERLPKISFAEKAAPLYISKLSITEKGFQLNDTKYRFGVLRQAREGPTPELFKSQNRKGGFKTDIDQFGFEKRSLPELTPGDILIQDFNRLGNPIDNIEIPMIPMIQPMIEHVANFELMEADVVRYRRRLTDLEVEKKDIEYGPKEELEPYMVYQIDRRGRRDQLPSQRERLKKINNRIRQAKMVLEHAELELQRYQCRRDNVPAPYDMFIQLTETSPGGTLYIERFNYDKRLLEAQKYLICKFLGHRQLVIKIKSLSFWAHLRGGLVVGLPEGIKMDVQEFKTSGNLSEVLQRVETILEYPNRPFARLESTGLRLVDAQNAKVRNAGVLVLSHNFRVDYVAMCREVPNKKVVVTMGRTIEPGQYAVIVENLINRKGTLGTCYEITVIRKEDKAKEVLRVIGERFGDAVVGESLVTIPLPNQLQLNVTYEPYQFSPELTYYTIKMEVIQSQSD
ncbi:unnamed protein product [Caenorhabditis nigoni]